MNEGLWRVGTTLHEVKHLYISQLWRICVGWRVNEQIHWHLRIFKKISRIPWRFGIFYIPLQAVGRTPRHKAGGKQLKAKGQRACPDALNLMGRKAFTTLWFWRIEIWTISHLSKNKADVNATKGVVYSMPILYLVGRGCCILSAGLMGGLYTLVEFVLCSFQTSGQSRASSRGTSKLYERHVFYSSAK